MAAPICVIPARGGSKRVPRKNIRLLAGLPLIAHSIRTARESGLFDSIVVSTDDEEIASIAREHGATVPFMRSAELADDFAGTAEVFADAIARSGAGNAEFACCLYPTAPLVRAGDLRDSLSALAATDAGSLLPVTEFDYPPLRALRRAADGTVSFNWPEHERSRSQDLPHLVHDAGAFYWVRVSPFLERLRLVGPDTIGWPMPRDRVVDIDTEEDFRVAEALYELQGGRR